MAARGSTTYSDQEIAWWSQVVEKLLRGADVSSYGRNPIARRLVPRIETMKAQAALMKRRTEGS